MKAMHLVHLGPMSADTEPLSLVELPIPEPARGEIRIRVSACGVCHTELDEIEGRTAPPSLPIIPGHEAVGRVDALGENAGGHRVGDRVGVGWIHTSSGSTDENLSPAFCATGRDVNGGYAEYLTAPAAYAYRLPDCFKDVEAAPLLCAGAVGYRALRLTELMPGEAIGFTGFGSSAHLMLQMVGHHYPNSTTAVFARDPAQREHALELGADWAGATTQRSPFMLDAVIDTTPAWLPVVEALPNLKPGGRLVINAIRKEDGDKDSLLRIRYESHLWLEKTIRSVANVTGADIAEFLPLAAEVPLRPEIETYPFEDANKALLELRFAPIRGAKVLSFDNLDG